MSNRVLIYTGVCLLAAGLFGFYVVSLLTGEELAALDSEIEFLDNSSREQMEMRPEPIPPELQPTAENKFYIPPSGRYDPGYSQKRNQQELQKYANAVNQQQNQLRRAGENREQAVKKMISLKAKRRPLALLHTVELVGCGLLLAGGLFAFGTVLVRASRDSGFSAKVSAMLPDEQGRNPAGVACPNCGRVNSPHTRICPRCESVLQTDEMIATQPTTEHARE